MLARVNKSYVPAYWDDFFNDRFFNEIDSMNYERTLPAVNIRESEEGFELELALPGLKREDIQIKLEEDVLRISSEKKEEAGDYTRREFNYQSFERQFKLGELIDQEGIEASHEAGVLSIRLPKKAEVLSKVARQIEIH